MPMDTSVAGLRVIVTAGGAGIGRRIATRFHEHGALVFVCDVSEAALAELRNIERKIGTALADVGDPAAVERLFAAALPALGGLDVLVNNAGISGPTAAAEDVTPADWDRTLAVNISGQFYCARLAIPAMKRAGGGSMVNISSTSGKTGLPLRLPYAVSKHAVMGFTETLAREVGPFGIRVNTILPGFMNNARSQRIIAEKSAALGITPEAYLAQGLQYVSLRTMIEEVEIADMAVFLCSPAARHVTGQAIGVCGNVEYER